MSEFTREQIIEAAKHCVDVGEGKIECEGCPFDFDVRDCSVCISDFARYITESQKEEPAPSANDTSSKNDNSLSHLNDTSKSKICQELISQAQTDLLTIYDGMSEGECRAWELGELFKTLEFAKKAGEQE